MNMFILHHLIKQIRNIGVAITERLLLRTSNNIIIIRITNKAYSISQYSLSPGGHIWIITACVVLSIIIVVSAIA